MNRTGIDLAPVGGDTAETRPAGAVRQRTPLIALPADQPGILALFAARPSAAAALGQLAQTLLRGPSSLSPGQREAIAAEVSRRNGCHFCAATHGAAAEALASDGRDEVLGPLLEIAGAVRVGGSHVTPELVAAARAAGADDVAIHDTVLIAAAFCMFNRYVDGLGTADGDPHLLRQLGIGLADSGYLNR